MAESLVTTAQDLIDSAYRRAKIASQVVTAEMSEFALKALYHLLLNYANKIELLWRVDTKPYGLYTYKAGVYMEDNTVDVLNVNHRTVASVGGTASSSASGSATSATNTDEEDYLLQTSADGSLTIDAGASIETKVDVVGVMAYQSNDYNLVFEVSSDGSTWRQVHEVLPPTGENTTNYQDRVWHWYDIVQPISSRYFRIRETSGGTLSLRHAFFGKIMTEIPMSQMNRDDYMALPNKKASGRPLQYWKDRQQNAPVLWVWPTPDSAQRFNQIVVTRHAHIIEPTLSEPLNLPLRWTALIKASLASDLALEYAEMVPDPNWPLTLLSIKQALERDPLSEERDNSKTNFHYKIRRG